MAEEIKFTTAGAEQVAAAQEKINRKHREGRQAVKLTNDETAKLGAITKRIYREIETPQEKYLRKMREARVALAGQRSSVELLGRAEKKFAADRDAALERNKRKLDENKKAMDGAFNPARLTQFVLGFASVNKAISVVRQGLQDVEADAQAAADRSVQSLGSAGELAQLFSTPEEFQGALKEARGLLRRGIFKADQESQALDYVFALRSAGYTKDDRDFLAEIGQQRYVRPESLKAYAATLRKFQTGFGAKETGGIRDIANKITVTSRETQSSAAGIAAAGTEFAKSAGAIGIRDEEALAALALIERGTKNETLAATQLGSLYDAVSKKGLKSRGWTAAILDEIAAREAAGFNPFKILGRKEAVKAYRALQDERKDLAPLTRRLFAAPGEDIIGKQLGFIETDPRTKAAKLLEERSGARQAQLSELRSEKENLFGAYREDFRAYYDRVGQSVRGAVLDQVNAAIDAAGLEDVQLRDIATGNVKRPDLIEKIIQPDTLAAIKEYVARLDSGDGASKIEQKTQTGVLQDMLLELQETNRKLEDAVGLSVGSG